MPYILTGLTDVASIGTAAQISNTPRRVMSITFVNPTGQSAVYVGNDGAGDVSATTGIPLLAGEEFTFNFTLANVTVPISDFWVDAAVNGEDVAWGAIMET